MMSDLFEKLLMERERLHSELYLMIAIITFLFTAFFFFNDTATAEIYTNLNTLSLHDALPIYSSHIHKSRMPSSACDWSRSEEHTSELDHIQNLVCRPLL